MHSWSRDNNSLSRTCSKRDLDGLPLFFDLSSLNKSNFGVRDCDLCKLLSQDFICLYSLDLLKEYLEWIPENEHAECEKEWPPL